MSPENVELLRSIFAARERGDFSDAGWAHPEIEYVIVDGPEPTSYKGLAGLAQSGSEHPGGLDPIRPGITIIQGSVPPGSGGPREQGEGRMRALADLRTAGRSPGGRTVGGPRLHRHGDGPPRKRTGAHGARLLLARSGARSQVDPCAGGEVPTPRSLASAVAEDRFSTRIVCSRTL